MKKQDLNGHTAYFNLTIHRDLLKEVKSKAEDLGIYPSHYITDLIKKDLSK